jgi:hypothetical protein
MTAVTAPAITGHQLTAALVRWYEGRVKAPIMFTEIALDGAYGSMGRLDAVAVWLIKDAGVALHGYEVKITRADFHRDNDAWLRDGGTSVQGKWRKYLHRLNSFSFAAPAGLIKPEEVPDPAGLIVYSPTKGSWNVVKKAGPTGGQPQLDTVVRLLRRSHGIGQGHVRYGAPELSDDEKRARRLADKARYETESELAGLINGRVRETIRSIRAREANIDARVEQLERDRRALDASRDKLDGAPEALRAVARVADLVRDTLAGYGTRPDDARARLAAILETLDGDRTAQAAAERAQIRQLRSSTAGP